MAGRIVAKVEFRCAELFPRVGLIVTNLSLPRREARLPLSLPYNLGSPWRRLVLPKRIEAWTLTSLQQRWVKAGEGLVKHVRHYWLSLAEGHLHRSLFGQMLRRIWALPVPSGTAIAGANSEAEEGGLGSVRENDCTAASGICQTAETSRRNTAELVGPRPDPKFDVVKGGRSV